MEDKIKELTNIISMKDWDINQLKHKLKIETARADKGRHLLTEKENELRKFTHPL